MPSFDPLVETDSDSDALAFPTFTEAAPASKPSKQPDLALELLEVFRLEAEDHLRVLTKTLPRAKKETVTKDEWLEVLRAAHTLKGAAAMVGFAEVTTLAHGMEDLLDLYYEGTRTATPAEVDWLLACTDGIDDAINGQASNLVALLQRGQSFIGTTASTPAQVSEPASREGEAPAEPQQDASTATRSDANEAYVRPVESRLPIPAATRRLMDEAVDANRQLEVRVAAARDEISRQLERLTHDGLAVAGYAGAAPRTTRVDVRR